MPKIKVLPQHEACKIAAGEVVERPANVVKELVENSLDAGATFIEIYLAKSGKDLIRVVDNGCGMSAEDSKLCFAHHATSKISTVEDLDTINSFGFRGEALSSISSVSKVTLVTMEKESQSGVQTMLEDGKVILQEDIASDIGTDIKIENLFYNLPARQKFLKKDETEWRQVMQLFHAFVFDYERVHFKLFSDDRLIYNCPPVQKLSERLAQLWDSNISENLLEVSGKDEHGVEVRGVISNHQVFRYNRANMFCFVNSRLVKNYELSRAILKGYTNVLPNGKYPAAVIFIDLPNDLVDINVHPRKEEVTFLNPRRVENLLTNAVKQAMEKNLSSHISNPESFNQQHQTNQAMPFESPSSTPKKFKGARFSDYDFDSFIDQVGFSDLEANTPSSSAKNEQQENVIEFEQEEQKSFVERNFEVIGQFNQTYILVSKKEGLLLVDQHAAHERVLYEMFKNRFEQVVTVNLMFPATIRISESDLETLKPHIDVLKNHGITAEIFGKDQIIIQSTPTYLKQVKLDGLINQLVAWINEYQSLDLDQFKKEINEKMHAQMACKAAVKAGDILSNEQMYELLDDLEKSSNHMTCPHGRPTFWHFSINEIEKKFKRKL